MENLLKKMKNAPLLLVLMFILASSSQLCAQWSTGLEALQQVENWPLYRESVLCGQLSSSDPLGGDNDGSGFLYQQDSLYVIFDQEGPGCVYRIWIRNLPAAGNRTIKFFFDDEPVPTINTNINTLFSGLYQDFQAPLVGNGNVSSGGDYCYLPLPFAQHLKIALTGTSLPHQIAYHLYPTGTTIQTYSGADPSAVVAQWQSTGADPKNTSGNHTEAGSLVLSPNQSASLFLGSGAGSISGIRLTPNPATLSVLEGVRLRCYWESSPSPQVDCPLGDFFGSSLGLTEVAGLPVGMEGNDLYCYFPMPFWDSARVDLYNPLLTTDVSVNYEISYRTDAYPTESGYFQATHNTFQSTSPGQDMILGELYGHGNLAGMLVTLSTTAGSEFLHGDLRLYLDGLQSPSMQGTDFDGDFNAGNYLTSNPFTLPMHGVPVEQLTSEKKICAYRFFLGDLVPYGNQANLRAEHGNRNSVAMDYSSVIYSYHRPELALVLSDELDVGNTAEEAAHAYIVQGGQSIETHYYAYPGTYDDQFFTDQGRIHFGTSYLTIAIDPENRGVRLVRRRDASIFPQTALVSVNGDSVGLWCDPDFNYYKRWSDSVFEIPAAFTTGLSQIQIGLSQRGSQGWSEYFFKIHSHVPPRTDNIAPAQVSNVSLESLESGSQMHLQWEAVPDENGLSCYRLYRSQESGFVPGEANFVDESVLTSFTDQRLDPGTWYYYRISAVDYAGNEGAASDDVGQRTSSTFAYEVELLPLVDISTGDTAAAQNMIAYGEDWSNQAQMLLLDDDTGDFFSVNLQFAQADTYDIAAYFTKGPNYGIASLKVDGLPVGTPYDLFAAAIARSPKVELGSRYFSAGAHRFTFEVAGKNFASSDYRLGVDNLLLTSHYLVGIPPINPAVLPPAFRLDQNYPNPFNTSTRISFALPVPGQVDLRIFDLAGRQVAILKNSWSEAGEHSVLWETEGLSSGIYFLVLRQNDHQSMRKTVLLK